MHSHEPYTMKPADISRDHPHLIMAPFKGLTTKAYRNGHARWFGGLDKHLAPFVSGTGTRVINPSKLSDFLPVEANHCETIPQIISTSAEEIILFAKTMRDHGCDHINWNLGCPFPRIAIKKRGCGLLPYPGEIDAILGKVMPDIPLELSVKTRLGFRDPAEIDPVLRIFNQYPLKEITIHPRIGTQVYRGEVNLQGFASCLEISKHPLIYNGDLFNLGQYRKLSEAFPQIRTWMPGRGLLINPFLALEIKGIHLPDAGKRERIRAFHQELLLQTGSSPSDGNIPGATPTGELNHRPSPSDERKRLGFLKNIWYYMAGCFADGEKLFSDIKTVNNPETFRHKLHEWVSGPFATDEQIEAYFRHAIKHIGKDPADC